MVALLTVHVIRKHAAGRSPAAFNFNRRIMMRGFIRGLLAALVFAVLLGYPSVSQAQRAGNPASQRLITSARVEKAPESFDGPVYVTINGRELKIADAAYEAWVIDGGRKVVYSWRDGAGGFEDEGQSLRVYDAQTRRTRKVMSEYVIVDSVTEVRTASGKIALIVKMVDGGLGGQYFAVVDPLRGEVFYRQWARLLSRKGDTITLGLYREGDWGEIMENKKVRPYKTERYNLSALLKRRVIYNKRDRPF
jgi:hypothetical protein